MTNITLFIHTNPGSAVPRAPHSSISTLFIGPTVLDRKKQQHSSSNSNIAAATATFSIVLKITAILKIIIK